MKSITITILFTFIASFAGAQNVSTRSHEFTVDLSDAKNLKDTSVPLIHWEAPATETIFLREARLPIKIEVTSSAALKEISLQVREKTASATMRGSSTITPKPHELNKMVIEKSIAMPEGVNVLEVVVVNVDGVESKSYRIVHVGETALADAAKLGRNDYAVLFLTDKYDNWNSLVNPIADGRAIAGVLEKIYGFKVDIVENPSQDQIFRKIREYTERKYQPLDQLMIFFAGHGYFDESFKEGFVVVKESLKDDPGKTSYVSYNRLRNVMNVIPCEHVMLMMDVCFGGTFDDAIATARDIDVYKEVSQSEFIIRKLAVKTRKYLTSGGKQYVSDGVPGKHSPFAKRVIDALNSLGGNDGILTLTELYPYVDKLNPEPRLGKFGDDAPGSEFIFVVK